MAPQEKERDKDNNKERELKILMYLLDDCQVKRLYHAKARTAESVCLMAAYTTIIGLLIKDSAPEKLAYLLLVLSIVGIISSLTHSQRYVFYWRRTQVLREEMDKQFMEGRIDLLNKAAKKYRNNEDGYKFPHNLPKIFTHHLIWLVAHSAALITAIVMLWP